jgi:hypothetical protein
MPEMQASRQLFGEWCFDTNLTSILQIREQLPRRDASGHNSLPPRCDLASEERQ